MKVILTASGRTMESLVDPRFGRAAFFVLADTESGAVEAHDNAQNLSAAQGAGIQAAETVSRLGAEVVITGHCGPKAFRRWRQREFAWPSAPRALWPRLWNNSSAGSCG